MTLMRKLAAMVNSTRGDLVRTLGERFHTLEQSRGRAAETHDEHALYTGAPAVKNGGRRGLPRGLCRGSAKQPGCEAR